MRTRTAEAPRRRRQPDQARIEILEAAERRLIKYGPEGVHVQTVARDLGLTDAAIHYHFGSREGLVEALVKFAGRRLKDRVATAVERWDAETIDIASLVAIINETYGDRGYARLVGWLSVAGWRPEGVGMFRPLADAIHHVRVRRAHERRQPAPPLEDTLFTVALLNLVLFAEPLAGSFTRRSLALSGDHAMQKRFLDWLGDVVERQLLGPPRRGLAGERGQSAS